MTVSAKLRDECREDNLICRIVELASQRKKHSILGPSLSSKAPLKILNGAMRKELQEIFIRVGLDELREIDGDKTKQDTFISNHFRMHESESLTFTVLKILIPGEMSLRSEDVDYVYDLLQFPGNDFVTTPILYRNSQERPMVENPCPEEYFSFLHMYSRLLKRDSINTIGFLVPSYVSGRKVDDAFAKMKDFDTPFIGYDFHGRRAFTSYPDISRLRRLCNEKEGENYFLYSFDSKGYRQGSQNSPAEDALELTYGISSFGPRHYNPPRRIPATPPDVTVPPRLVDKESFVYSRDSSSAASVEFTDWANAHDVDLSSQSSQYAYSKWFNNLSLHDMSRNMERSVIDGNLTSLLTGKTMISGVVKSIMKKNRQI